MLLFWFYNKINCSVDFPLHEHLFWLEFSGSYRREKVPSLSSPPFLCVLDCVRIWVGWRESKQEEKENAEDGLRWRCSVLTKCDRINNGNCIASHSHTPPAVGLQTNVCVHVLNDCKYKVMSRPNGTSTVLGPLNLWSRYMVEEGIAVSPSRNNFMAASACLNMSLFIEYWDPSIRLWLQAKMTTRWNAWGRQGRVYLIFLFFFPCDLRHLRIKAQVKSGPFLHSHALWLAAPSTRTDQE